MELNFRVRFVLINQLHSGLNIVVSKPYFPSPVMIYLRSGWLGCYSRHHKWFPQKGSYLWVKLTFPRIIWTNNPNIHTYMKGICLSTHVGLGPRCNTIISEALTWESGVRFWEWHIFFTGNEGDLYIYANSPILI